MCSTEMSARCKISRMGVVMSILTHTVGGQRVSAM